MIEGLSYDEVLLVPEYSDISSRSEIDVSVKLGPFNFAHGIIPANMKSIVSQEMAEEIIKSGGLATLHRFMPIEEQYQMVSSLINTYGSNNLAVSIGVKVKDRDYALEFEKLGIKIVCIDIAHGDSQHCIEMIKWLKSNTKLFVIAGNVATGKGAERLWMAGADVVKVGVGGGCFSAGTRVLMSNGFYKNIEDIKENDYVINKNGKPVKVLDAFCTGTKKVLKLRNNIFYKDTFVTPDHRFWVGDLNSNSKNTLNSKGYSKLLDINNHFNESKYKWKEIEKIKQDVLLIPNKINFDLPVDFNINLKTKNKPDININANYDSGYLFGTFLGDGNAICTQYKKSNSGAVKWYFGLNELDVANKLSLSINKLFNKNTKIKVKNNNMQVVNFYFKSLAVYLNTWGKKDNKSLPQELLVNNKEYLQGLYDGLLDSDGCYDKDNRQTLFNTSTSIIELFNVINYLLFGIFPNNLKIKPTIGNLKNANINNFNQSYSSQKLKNGKVRLTKNYQVVKPLEVDKVYTDMLVYDITVDCNTHSFIANNMIVHNSTCSTRLEAGAGVAQFTAISEVAKMQKLLRGHKNTNFWFIADGGIKNTAGIVKALALADMVMIGNLFAGCQETDVPSILIDGIEYRQYAGSSTHKDNHIEGVIGAVLPKGKYKDILAKMLEGLRSGCSYQGAHNLTELKDNPQFMKISHAGIMESYPHDVKVIK
jgi:IMP dehydrogenase/GMP reductase